MSDLVFDDYDTLPDGRRSAVGHHFESGVEDASYSVVFRVTEPARSPAQRFWQRHGRELELPNCRERVKAIRAGASPNYLWDAKWIEAVIARSGVLGVTDYDLRHFFAACYGVPGVATFSDRILSQEEVEPILSDLEYTHVVFSMACCQVPPCTEPAPRRPFACRRYFHAEYPDFQEQPR
jgi:hypothetical protein